jgi:hypothetical protein
MTGDTISSIDEARRKKDIEELKAKLVREMLPRMLRWQEVFEILKRGAWPSDPQFEMIDTPIEVVLAILNECIDAIWLELAFLPKAEREKELDRLAKEPMLREWLRLHKANVARAKAHLAEHRRRGSVARLTPKPNAGRMIGASPAPCINSQPARPTNSAVVLPRPTNQP